MTENSSTSTGAPSPAQWPPKRKPRAQRAAATHPKPPWTSKGTKSTRTVPSPPSKPPPPPPPPLPLPLPRPVSPDRSTPLRDVLNERKRKVQFRSGWEVTPKPPSYTPYELDRDARKRLKISNLESATAPFNKFKPLSEPQWNSLARQAGFIEDSQALRDFQMQCANAVISRIGDVVVVAPTGAGKSLVWALPLLVAKEGISLVVTPYTSLGIECEQRANAIGIPSVFVHAKQRSEAIFEGVSQGHFRIVFVCPEMLESPAFAFVLHSKLVQSHLLAVYLDEAHLVHEAAGWRTSYERLHQVRRIVGSTVPLIAISATLPASYRLSLLKHAGLRHDYRLINLGNFRPELSTVVIKLEDGRSSFDSLRFVLPDGVSVDTLRKTIVYCDDINKLNDMLWWFDARLRSLRLPTSLVEILHAGLSDTHENIVMTAFNLGEAKIFIATEKVGAGINFPNVEQVVVYLVQKDLTLAKFEQRKGRAGRTPGSKGVGILMVQSDILSPQKSSTVDPGILALIQTNDCLDKVLDQWLDNPPRVEQPEGRLCCSNCHASLQPPRSLQWIMEDPASKAAAQSSTLTDEEMEQILSALKEWRLRSWEQEWRALLPGYAPEDLISDTDLENVTKHALTIAVAEDLYRFTQIVYWSIVGQPLFTALEDARRTMYGNLTHSEYHTSDVSTSESVPDVESRTMPSVSQDTLEPNSSGDSDGLNDAHSIDPVSSHTHSSSNGRGIPSTTSTKPLSVVRASRTLRVPTRTSRSTKASQFGEQVISFS